MTQTITKVAQVSEIVRVEDTTKFNSIFAIACDHNYMRFKEQLLREYQLMRTNYMHEYQSNYELNSKRQEDRLTEVTNEINSQDREIIRMKGIKQAQKEKLFHAFKAHFKFSLLLKTWEALKENTYQRKLQKRKNAFVIKEMAARKAKLMFYGWRKLSHRWFKQRIDSQTSSFREEMESTMLLKYTTEVDRLLIVMANLEEDIKLEQQRRQVLTEKYEVNINSGIQELN